MNMPEVARAAGIAHSTLRRYLALLEATFIFQPLTAWSNNIGKRCVRSPNIHLLDSGLAAHLRGDVDAPVLAPNPGPLLETFVVQEVRKLLGWSRHGATPYHFRTAAGQEVDLVLEARGQRIAGIVRLNGVAKPKAKCVYLYDVGDDWAHEVRVERELESESGKREAICVAGENACPPEDCGGVPGYLDMLDVLADAQHEEYGEMREWLGDDFDSRHFDVDQTNKSLRRLKV
jgi:hypothetical protein